MLWSGVKNVPIPREHLPIIEPVPETCNLSKILRPDRPMKWWEIMIIGLAAVGLGYLLIREFKK